MLQNLTKKIKDRKANVGIIGLGYVGLPLAVEYAESGFNVTGLDIAKDKIKLINAGKSYIDDIPDARVAGIVKDGRFHVHDG